MSTARAGAIAGLVFIAGMIIATFIVPPPPAADEPAADFLEYFTDNRTALMIQSSIQASMALVLLLFLPGFRRWLGGDNDVSAVAVVAIGAGWAATAALTMMVGGLAYLSDTTLAEDDARNLLTVLNLSFSGIVIVVGAGTALAGVILLQSQGAARIAGGLGVLVAVLAVLTSFSWADSGFFSPGPSILLPFLGALIFILFVSILMLRGAKTGAPA